MGMTSIQSTLTQIENDTNRVNHQRGLEHLGSDKLDKQAFLQLLMAKLKYQDPLNPVQDSDFLNNQAQLAQVEKLDDLLQIMQGNSLLSQASGLVGKRVDVLEVSGATSTGTIESAAFSNGSMGLFINGHSYSPNQVIKIYGS